MERILSLDISSKTGYAVIDSNDDGSYDLEAFGQIKKIEMPDGYYPAQYVDWAYECFGKILALIEKYAPSVLVIEETSKGSKNAYSQKILEWIHFLVAKFIKETGIKAVYMLTEEWRRATGCLMSKEESAKNKKVREYKKKNKTSIAYDENDKRIGKITRKHVNVRRANELFGQFLPEPLRQKNEDTADSLLLGISYHMRRTAKK